MTDSDEMFGVKGASDEVEALAVAIWAHRCPGLLMDEDNDRPHYMAAAKAAFDALDENYHEGEAALYRYMRSVAESNGFESITQAIAEAVSARNAA